MSELTVGQLWKAREALEQTAATLLGKMLFEFARLDVVLGLCVVWVDDGKHLKALTKQASDFSFKKKLDFLTQFVERSLPVGSKQRIAYTEWIEQAHTARLRRNELVHGRWGVDPVQEHVINVIGLPTSPEQREVRYSLQDLESVLEELKQLQVRLRELRDKWPL